MNRRSLVLMLMSIAFLSGYSFSPPADILEAMELCDKSDLRPIEGLWEFPEDDVKVMIFRNSDNAALYDIYVVESADCSLSPGNMLGTLHVSPDPNKFKLSLYTQVKKGVLSVPCTASAVLSINNESITVTKPSMKITFYPGRLLGGFWNVVRLTKKDATTVPDGLIRIYPSYDGNASSKRNPRYL